MREKKVCVVTWYSSANCGTCLQAKALYDTVYKIADAVMLSYKRNYSILNSNDRSIVANKIVIKTKKKFVGRRGEFIIKPERQTRVDFFVKNSFKLVPLPAGSDRKSFVEGIDCFIVGSDQLWNPYWFNPTYYLDFVEEREKKKSYSTSIGVSEISPRMMSKMRRLINGFSEITVRESSAQELLSSLLRRDDIDVVADPTMLLTADDWRGIMANNSEISYHNEDYILCYFVGGIKKHQEVIRKIKDNIGKKVVVIPMQPLDYSFENCEFVEAGPYEFLQLISYAAHVCTDSFHAIAISIIFHRCITVLERQITAYGNSQGSRITEILKKYGMEKNQYSIYKEIVNKVDYEKVDRILNDERIRSLSKLYSMLGVN